ncbi:MAG TPA: prepilin peptidase [Caulobacteraceae bacterium]|jgi:prepilin peptidase CpaA
MQTAIALALSLLPILMIISALSDVTTMTIPNRVSIALVLGFYPTALLDGLSVQDVAISTGIGLALLVAGMGMFALRWVGGGDAKLFAAAGLWIGLPGLAPYLMWTTLAGGMFSLGLILMRNWMHPYAAGAPAWVGRLLAPKGDVPFGVAIAAGALAAYPAGVLIRGFHGVF